VVKVNAGVADATVISNTATVASTTTDPVPGNNSATATTTVTNPPPPVVPDLSITVTAPATANRNTVFVPQIKVTNNNATVAALLVTMHTDVPANTTYVGMVTPGGWTCTTPPSGGTGPIDCSIASLAGAATGTFNPSFLVNTSVDNDADMAVTATTASTPADPTPGNNSATSHTAARSIDLVMSSNMHPSEVNNAGATDPLVQFTAILTNQGGISAPLQTVANTGTGKHTFIAAMPAGTILESTSNPGNFTSTQVISQPAGANPICHLVAAPSNSLQTGSHVEVQCHEDGAVALPAGQSYVIQINVYFGVSACGNSSMKLYADPDNVIPEGTTGEANNQATFNTHISCGDIDIFANPGVGDDLSVTGGYTASAKFKITNDGGSDITSMTVTGHVTTSGTSPTINTRVAGGSASGFGANGGTTSCNLFNITNTSFDWSCNFGISADTGTIGDNAQPGPSASTVDITVTAAGPSGSVQAGDLSTFSLVSVTVNTPPGLNVGTDLNADSSVLVPKIVVRTLTP
jgi:hypothetical protein